MNRKKNKNHWFGNFCGMILMIGIFLSGAVSVSAEENNFVSDTSKINQSIDVVFVIENSEKFWAKQNLRNQALHSAVHLAAGSDIRIGSVYFADDIYRYYSLKSVHDEKSYRQVSDHLNLIEKDRTKTGTNIGIGLKNGLALFEDQNQNRRKVMILLSDGMNSNPEAEELTAQQAELLYAKNVELYCVSMQNTANEAYLRKLVNYFKDENEYDQTRYFSVAQDDIQELGEKFTEIFYSLRGDVRVGKIAVDYNGYYDFEIPKLNVKKLQIYTSGSPVTAKLICKSHPEQKVEKWVYSSNTVLTAEYPSDEWQLRVYGDTYAIQSANITIAYYTDLRASLKLFSEDDKIKKGSQVKITANFADSNGKELLPDSSSKIQVSFKIKNIHDQQQIMQLEELPLKFAEGVISSDEFTIQQYGDIEAKLLIYYGDTIQLEYHFGDLSNKLTPCAPVALKDYTQNMILASRVSSADTQGYQFSLNLAEYIKDEDSSLEDIKISNVNSQEDNHLQAEIKDGKIIITAERAANLNGIIELEDESGLTAKIKLEGYLMDEGTAAIIIPVLVGILFLAFVIAIVHHKSKKDKENNQKKIKEYQDKIFPDLKKKFQNGITNIEEQQKNIAYQEYKNSWSLLNTILEKAQADEAIKNKLLGGLNFRDPKVDHTFSELLTKYQNINKEIDKILTPKNFNSSPASLLRTYEAYQEKWEKDWKEGQEKFNSLPATIKQLENETQQINALNNDLNSRQFANSITVQFTYHGKKYTAYHGESKAIFYLLDEFEVMGHACKIKEIIQNQNTQVILFSGSKTVQSGLTTKTVYGVKIWQKNDNHETEIWKNDGEQNSAEITVPDISKLDTITIKI